jgi:adenylosuccinate lyase
LTPQRIDHSINAEARAKLFHDSNQPVPASIAVLLATARRENDRHEAKKMANRKSASCSRARKKSKDNAMAQENVKLKRESDILSHLPDPVRSSIMSFYLLKQTNTNFWHCNRRLHA